MLRLYKSPVVEMSKHSPIQYSRKCANITDLRVHLNHGGNYWETTLDYYFLEQHTDEHGFLYIPILLFEFSNRLPVF